MEKLKFKRKMVLATGILLLLASLIIAISIGGSSMDPYASFTGLLLRGTDTENTIIWSIRVPRIIEAILAGGGLAIVGCTFQGIFRNPMADPFVLGISSGAALGASIAIVSGISLTIAGFTGVSVLAFTGAMLTVSAIYLVSSIRSSKENSILLLTGIALNFFFSSIIYLLMFIRYDKMKEIVMWTFGTFSTASWDKVFFLAPVVVIGSMLLGLFARDLNSLVLGEKEAHSFGVSVEKSRNLMILIGTIITAVIVSASGIIGFVGLMIPHLLRFIVGSDYRKLLPMSFLYGTIFLLLSDTIARTVIRPSELPIGAITALFGSPFFIFILLNRKKGY